MVKHTQTIRRLLPTNCLCVFDHFVGLAPNVLLALSLYFRKKVPSYLFDMIRKIRPQFLLVFHNLQVLSTFSKKIRIYLANFLFNFNAAQYAARKYWNTVEIDPKWVSPFQLSVSFHIKPFIKTGHLFCRAKQMTGFFMKRNKDWNGLKNAEVPFRFFIASFIMHVVCYANNQQKKVRLSFSVNRAFY